MTEDCIRRTTCRLCGSDNLQLVLQLAVTPVGDAYVTVDRLEEEQKTYPNDLFLCLDCSHAQLLDVIDPDILYGNFTYTTGISLGLAEHFEQYSCDVAARCHLPQQSLVIDIGSNDGTLLGYFKGQGHQVLGVDPARRIAESATARGIETLPAYFTAELARRIREQRGPAALITTNNTFANIDDLGDMMEGVRELLAPDGVLVMETGYVVEQVINGVFDNIYHEHISYFALTPLLKFFPKHGFKIFDVQTVETKGGSIRCYIQLDRGVRPESASLQRIAEDEKAKGFTGPAPYLELAGKIADAGRKLKVFLDEIKSGGASIAGFGASVGVTTLLYEFGLESYVDFLVDDNPLKHNTYSPGHHIPVYSPEALGKLKPDYLLILPWRYAAPIMARHRSYAEQGGRFICPWPRLRVDSI